MVTQAHVTKRASSSLGPTVSLPSTPFSDLPAQVQVHGMDIRGQGDGAGGLGESVHVQGAFIAVFLGTSWVLLNPFISFLLMSE